MFLFRKTLLKAVTALTLLFALTGMAYGQKHSVRLRNVPVKTVPAADDLSLDLKTNQIDMDRIVSVQVKNGTIQEVLGQIFIGQDVSCTVDGKKIQVSKAEKSAAPQTPPKAARHLVSGRVSDSSGEPIIGCIIVPGDNPQHAVSTDLDGNYTLEVPRNGILEFSYVGFHTIREDVADRSKINVVMRTKTENLDAVVVVGYGTSSKRLVSSSIASSTTLGSMSSAPSTASSKSKA